MTAATLTRRPPETVSLREDWRPTSRSPLSVDRQLCIIHKIKILGWDSGNGRRYDPAAAKRALKLYEGAKCYSNHPARGATATRVNDDALGIWHDPVWTPDGVFADLHYLKTHPMAERVCEDAERGLGLFGASHNADGKVETVAGTPTVVEIGEVRSVDIVSDPATVSNLWEGRTIKEKVKVKTVLLEKALPGLQPNRAKRLQALAESLPDTLEMLVEDTGTEGPPADHNDHIYGAMKACSEAGEDDKAMILHKLLKPDASDDDDKDGDTKKPDASDSTEGRRPTPAAAGAEVLTEARALALCKATGVEATLEVTEALKGATIDSGLAILALAKRHSAPARDAAPRSTQRGGAAILEGTAPKDSKAWAERLLG